MKDKSRLEKTLNRFVGIIGTFLSPKVNKSTKRLVQRFRKYRMNRKEWKTLFYFFSSSVLHFALTYLKIDNLEMKNETENCSSFIFDRRTFFSTFFKSYFRFISRYMYVCLCVSKDDIFFHKINFLKGHEKMKVRKRENCYYDNVKWMLDMTNPIY